MRPLFVTFYTPDYEDCALELGQDAQRLHVNLRMVRQDNLRGWMEATYFKAFFMQAVLKEYSVDSEYDAFVWIDADARLRSFPELLYTLDPRNEDVAAHLFHNQELLSGTVWFGNNAKAREVVQGWVTYNSGAIARLEQRNLQWAIRDTPDVRFFSLPPEYTYIFDLSKRLHPEVTPIVEHMQRSRSVRRKERLCADRQSR
jgi:hypothetical protein